MSTMPLPPADDEFEYIPDPLGRIGRGTWRRKRQVWDKRRIDDPFDRLQAETEPFRLSAAVGRDGANERADVAKIEALLGRTGHLDIAATEGPTGYFGVRVDDAVKRFQKTAGLKADGLINPDGPTLAALQSHAAANDDDGNKGAAPSLLGDAGHGRSATPMPATSPAKEQQVAGMMLDGLDTKVVIPPQYRLPGQLMTPVPLSPRLVLPGFPAFPIPLPPLPVPPGPVETPKDRLPQRPPIIEQEHSGSGTPPTPANDNDQKRIMPGPSPTDAFLRDILRPYYERRRGDATTRRGNDIVVQECLKLLKIEFPALNDKIAHVGGAKKNGKGKDLPETYFKNAETGERKGSSYSDVTFGHSGLIKKNMDDPRGRSALNTIDVKKSGEPTQREFENFEKLKRNMKSEAAETLPKLRPGQDEHEFRIAARLACRALFTKWQDFIETGR